MTTFLGSGILALSLAYVTSTWQSQQADHNRRLEEYKRRSDLIARVSHNSQRSLDAYMSYKRIAVYLRQNADKFKKGKPVDKYVDVFGYEEAFKLSLTLYSYYLQTLTLESIYAEVALVYGDRDDGIKARAAQIIEITREMEPLYEQKKLDELKARLKNETHELIKAMEDFQKKSR